MLDNLLKDNRSHRSFKDEKIPGEILDEIVEVVRMCSAAKNGQNLRYTLVNSWDMCKNIFPFTAWAGAIEWKPVLSESPRAYILISSLNSAPLAPITLGMDIGIACQSMLLKAVDLGYGGCIIASFNKKEVGDLLGINTDIYTPQVLIALGATEDTVKIIDGVEGHLKYHRDVERKINYVPKLSLKDLIIGKF